MKRVIRLLSLLSFTLLFTLACRQTADTSQPPEILYGQDICEHCQMIISEEKMSAAYWTAAGQARRFDDIGGMINYYQTHEEEVASWWVHDLNSGAWLSAEDAYFVLGAGVLTPMGFDVVALADEDAARSLAYGLEKAEVLTLDELLQQRLSNGMAAQ